MLEENEKTPLNLPIPNTSYKSSSKRNSETFIFQSATSIKYYPESNAGMHNEKFYHQSLPA